MGTVKEHKVLLLVLYTVRKHKVFLFDLSTVRESKVFCSTYICTVRSHKNFLAANFIVIFETVGISFKPPGAFFKTSDEILTEIIYFVCRSTAQCHSSCSRQVLRRTACTRRRLLSFQSFYSFFLSFTVRWLNRWFKFFWFLCKTTMTILICNCILLLIFFYLSFNTFPPSINLFIYRFYTSLSFCSSYETGFI